VGTPGNGKTTLARTLAKALDVKHIELDAHFHQPDWKSPPHDEFRPKIVALVDAEPNGWVVCGNYTQALDGELWRRADTVIFMDLPRRVIMPRVIRRTLRRVITREELWNGNREPWTNLYHWDPERNIIRWAWVMHPVYRERYEQAMHDPQWEELDFVRLCTPAAVRWFEESLDG